MRCTCSCVRSSANDMELSSELYNDTSSPCRIYVVLLMRHKCRIRLNDLTLRSHMRMLKTVVFTFAWKTNIVQKFFLRTFALFGNLFWDGQNPFDDLEPIIPKSPAFHLQTFGKFNDLLNRKHFQSCPRNLERCGSRGKARTGLEIPLLEITIDKSCRECSAGAARIHGFHGWGKDAYDLVPFRS